MDETTRERTALCDLLDQLGPDQPTLCEGWRTRELAAHLLLRERRPLAAPGLVLRPLAGYTAKVQHRLAGRPFSELVHTLRRPPAWSPVRIPAVDHAVNSMELFIHHEDVRRGQPDWRPRELPAGLAAALWSRVKGVGRMRLRRFPAELVIEAPGYGEARTGAGGDQVRISGDPGELTLFLTGRQRAARVTLDGPEQLTDRLRTARLNL